MAKKLSTLVAGLSDREKRLVAIMGGAFVVFLVFVAAFLVRTSMSDLEDEIGKVGEALQLIDEKEGDYLAAKAEEAENEGMIGRKPPPLRSLVDNIGKDLSIVVPDMKELPDQAHGANWQIHGIELSLREVGLVQLVKFMEEVERKKRSYPIAITKLEVRKRRQAQDVYDAKLIVSTYEYQKGINNVGGAGGERKGGGR